MSDAHGIAYKLLTLGFSVIPSGGGNKGKAPIVNWTEYQKRKPTEDELEGWERELQPKLWGIVTNDHLGVIEADTSQTRGELEAELGQSNVLSPRGGAHWYIDTIGHPLKTITGILPGIDVRGVGGFINIVGSSIFGKYQILRLPIPGDLLPWERLPERIKLALNSNKPTKQRVAPVSEIIPETKRNATLASLAGSMRRRGMSQTAIEAALLETNQAQCQPPLMDDEVLTIARSISKYEPATPRIETKTEAVSEDNTPKLIRISDVTPEDVKWLCPPYIPLGKLTLLEGDPGVGKSWVCLAIAAAISIGHGIPGQTELGYGQVILASAEDGLADTIRPRLDSMRADINAIHAIDGLFTLDDAGFNLLEDKIREVVPILLIIDPLVAYLSGDMDINKANQVRYATSRLSKLAEKYGMAVLAIRHLTKGGNLKPIYRGLGSIDFTASARSVLLAGCDPDDPQIRGIVHIKSNLAPLGKPIVYELREDGFFWTDHCDLTADRIFAANEGENALDEAKSFLLDVLSEGEVPANDIYTQADNRGIAKRTLHRAEKELKIVVAKSGEPGEKGFRKWYWKLPGKEA